MRFTLTFPNTTDPSLATLTFITPFGVVDNFARFTVRKVTGGWLYISADLVPVIFESTDIMVDALYRLAYPYTAPRPFGSR